MTADRDRETRLAEAREEIARALTEPMPAWRNGSDHEYWLMRADAVLALPAFRAAGEGDRLRRDLAALAERLDRLGRVVLFSPAHAETFRAVVADLRDLLDGGEGGR